MFEGQKDELKAALAEKDAAEKRYLRQRVMWLGVVCVLILAHIGHVSWERVRASDREGAAWNEVRSLRIDVSRAERSRTKACDDAWDLRRKVGDTDQMRKLIHNLRIENGRLKSANTGLIRALTRRVLNTKGVLSGTTFNFKVKCPHSKAAGEECAEETVNRCVRLLEEEIKNIEGIESLVTIE